jgi:F0F1-type ATP synthase membrane subunit b/b'
VDLGVYYLVTTSAIVIMTLAMIYVMVSRTGRAIDEFGARVNASIERLDARRTRSHEADASLNARSK